MLDTCHCLIWQVIEEEQMQIDRLKSQLDDGVRRNEELENECLAMESKVKP